MYDYLKWIKFIIGRICDIYEKNPCLVHPCKNGECVPEPKSGEFTCNCYEGYFGPLCDSFLESECMTRDIQNAMCSKCI